MYSKTYVQLKYGACYLKNKVSAHRLGLVVQLSLRVAPPLIFDDNVTVQSWSPALMASQTEANIEELFPGYRKSCIIQVGGESIGNSGKSLSFKDTF